MKAATISFRHRDGRGTIVPIPRATIGFRLLAAILRDGERECDEVIALL
jgi:hypothetical protein